MIGKCCACGKETKGFGKRCHSCSRSKDVPIEDTGHASILDQLKNPIICGDSEDVLI